MTAAQTVQLSGGRTNAVWRHGDVVWKRYDLSKATPLFGNDPDAEWSALQSLIGVGIAPHPIKRVTDEAGRHLVYRFEPGETHQTPLPDLARLLGRLHRHVPPSDLPKAASGAQIIDMGQAMAAQSGTLLNAAPQPPDTAFRPTFCHRDPVPGNVVETAQGAKLIDWQCPAIGDPVEDIAHALSPAMHVLYGASRPTQAQRAAFLSAYSDHAVTARYDTIGHVYHWRMACYCEWQIARGVADYVPALQAELAHLSQYWEYRVSA